MMTCTNQKTLTKKPFISFFAAMLLTATISYGQPCSPETLMQIPGKWKPGRQGSINGVSATSLTKQKEIVSNFVKRLQNGIKLEGYNIYYSGVYGYLNPAIVKNRKMDSYELSLLIHSFYCENNKVTQHGETGYSLDIEINKIPYMGNQSFFVLKSEYEEDPKTDMLYLLEDKPIKDRSAWLIKEDFTSIPGGKRYQWVIAFNDELPYRYITQKELCTKLIAYYKEKDKEYQATETSIASNKKIIACAEDYLRKTPPEVLNSPAQVLGGMRSIFYQYWDNVPPFSSDGDYVIDISQNYFKSSFPMHTPQLIVLNFIVDERDEMIKNLMYKMVEVLNIENLKTMLGNPNPFANSNLSAKNSNTGSSIKVPTENNHPEIQNPPNDKLKNKSTSPGNKNNSPSPALKEITFDPSKPVIDADGNQYTVIKIGNQYWLRENLRTTQYNDTTTIATGLSDNDWKQTKQGAFAVYENNPLHNTTYGKLYNGYAVATGKLCPKGWRVATDRDWNELELSLNMPEAELERTGERGNIADKLKAPWNWKTSSFPASNTSRFGLQPGGARLDNGEFSTLNQYGNFWTSTVYDDRYGQLYLWNHHTHYNTNAIGRIYTLANNGYSCRCVKDNSGQ